MDIEGRRTAQNAEGPDRGAPDTFVGVMAERTT
jgi:hypothetical protein